MSRPSHTLTFPCPACHKRLTLNNPQAHGPCPHCHTPLQALFTVTALTPNPGDIPPPKGYDTRHFRPDTRPASQKHTPMPKTR